MWRELKEILTLSHIQTDSHKTAIPFQPRGLLLFLTVHFYTLIVLFYPENGDRNFLRNIGISNTE
jgi:hypothetical protein